METLTYLKRGIRLALRIFDDYKRHTSFCKKGEFPAAAHTIHLAQPILPSASFAEKQYNLQYAAEKIRQYTIRPGEVFSFWEIVGNPDKLKSSRSIRNNKVKMEKGGGLCQIAGIVYHLSLVGGLKIVERHHHSIDLYGDGPRACPIGLDATVSYGYKDLRIQNNTQAMLHFNISVVENTLHGELQSTQPLVQHEVKILKTETPNHIDVKTSYADTGEPIAQNIYKRL